MQKAGRTIELVAQHAKADDNTRMDHKVTFVLISLFYHYTDNLLIDTIQVLVLKRYNHANAKSH